MIPFNLFSCFLAFLVTAACLHLLRPLAIRIGLIDSPAGRKQHVGDVPLIGGVAMFLGFLFALLTLSISLLSYRSFIAAGALLVFVGILDDFHELHPKSRLVAQIAAALLMTVWGGVTLQNLGNLFFLGDMVLGNWGLPITIIAVVGIINAVNMTDGVDGLAGSLALVALIFLAIFAWQAKLFASVQIIALVIAVLVAFLCFNLRVGKRRQALVFMGDAGSMLLGFSIVWFLVDLSQGAHRVVSPAVMLTIMALPLFDTATVIISRIRQNRSPFSPDREHLHYLLHDQGFSPTQIVAVMVGISSVIGLMGVVAAQAQIADGFLFMGFLSLFVVYLWVIGRLKNR